MIIKRVVFNTDPFVHPGPNPPYGKWIEYSGHTFSYPDRPLPNFYPQPHNQLIYLEPFYYTGLTMKSANIICFLGSLRIEIEGGVPPYRYSYDNGITLSDPTTGTTYIFTIFRGSYEPYVEDSTGDFYRWTPLLCVLDVTFEPVYLTSIATGYILDQDGNQHTNAFTVTGYTQSSYSVTGVTTNNTVFLGWSYYKPTESTYMNFPLISTGISYTHQFLYSGVTIYAWFYKSGPASQDFCFFITSSGYTATDDDKKYFCSDCSVIVTVYFIKETYPNGLTNIHWYSNSGLTIDAGNGYYKPIIDDDCPPLYKVTTGNAIIDGTCCATLLCDTCVPVSTTTTTGPATTTTTTLALTTTTTTPSYMILYITQPNTDKGCGDEVGGTPYYAPNELLFTITELYTNSSLITKYVPASTSTFGWGSSPSPALSQWWGNIDINGDIIVFNQCTPIPNTTTTTTIVVNVGDYLFGGYVAHIFNDGADWFPIDTTCPVYSDVYNPNKITGWVVSEVDIDDGTQIWSPSGATIAPESDNIGDGYDHTQIILNNYPSENTYAKKCVNYSGNGYTDWILPSHSESLSFYILFKLNIGNFEGDGSNPDYRYPYATSTDFSTDMAWNQYVNWDVIVDPPDPNNWTDYTSTPYWFGWSGDCEKIMSNYHIRAIRYFSVNK